MNLFSNLPCGGLDHVRRRSFLQAAGGAAGLAWLTPLAETLGRAEEQGAKTPPKSLIVLWLQGGPSQLETFDPHPGTEIGGETTAIDTAAKGVQIASTFEQLATQMGDVALVRSVVSKEGDHERATHNVKTGYRPDPVLRHPSIGAILCHQLVDKLEIPRHISILPNNFAARGGYLGDQFDAFRTPDPLNEIPDVQPFVEKQRFQRRLESLSKVLEPEFSRGRLRNLDMDKTLHQVSTEAARQMMSSEQLKAFKVAEEPKALLDAFGENPFGRACLAAIRLIEVGVRCVEITLDGWDTHANNHQLQGNLVKTLDPAFATLLSELRARNLLEHTMVWCVGEFGRTPKINPLGGRDHWPHGFSMALAGGGIRGGAVIGETNSKPNLEKDDPQRDVKDPVNVEDVHATILKGFGVDYSQELQTPIGRPLAISQGKPIAGLLNS